jgi:iron uptake system component EfeO
MNNTPRALLIAFATTLLAAGAAACGGDSGSRSSGKGGTSKEVAFKLTDDGCSPSSATVPAGPVKIVVSNPGTSKTDELELKNTDGLVMGERENLAPGLTSDFTLTLQPGDYVLNCTFQNDQRDNGKLSVTGRPTRSAAAEGDPDLARAVKHYKAYVKRDTDALVEGTTAFVAALEAGDVAKAKALFGPTRIHYEAIEPIAESFGDLDPDIDARVNDVENKAKWTGFHRIEQILWTKRTTAGTDRYATRLLADVKRLDAEIDGLDLQAPQIANGAVGLLDEVSGSKITAEEDRYSHTDLADFQGNFTGAKEAFETLKPALVRRGDQRLIQDIDGRIAAVQDGLDRYKRHTPLGFALYSELTPTDRRAFAQQITALAEPMSLIAGKLLQR